MKIKLLSIVFLVIYGFTFSQEKVKYSGEELKMLKAYYFNEGFNQPATKKVSTVILKDGSVHKGYCKGVRTKKGQIFQIEFKDSISGQKASYDADKIAEAYLFASGMEKFGKAAGYFSNYGIGKRTSINKRTSSDEIYFVNQKVSLKNKKDEKEFLMQLINPDFNDIISVYHDPFAKETQGVKIGYAPTIGGGVIKSYYIKKGDNVMWLHKSDFEENYDFLFGDNAEFMKKYPYKSVSWDWLSALILEYTRLSLETQG